LKFEGLIDDVFFANGVVDVDFGVREIIGCDMGHGDMMCLIVLWLFLL
jgi:hypothetical protein